MKVAASFFASLWIVACGQDASPTWKPGDFSAGSVVEDSVRGTKIFLSNGLMGKAIAHDGEAVMASDGTQLAAAYHANCDGGATFAKEDGGYYYVSNSEFGEHPNDLSGGVYSLEFTAVHELVGYQRVLSNTAKNCHGGITGWGTWISCEEERQFGRCWQVDPAGNIEARATDLTGIYDRPEFGNWEAFAWDKDSTPPRGYITNDDFPDKEGLLPAYRGAIVRFTPDAAAIQCLEADNFADQWCAVESGTHEFLKLSPESDGSSRGTFSWVADVEDANPSLYGGSEGAHVEDGVFTFSTAQERYLFRLDLNTMTYVRSAVPFPFEPDNLRVLGDRVYLCTDGDHQPGDAVWGWDAVGAYRILHEENHNYPAGVDFTPDNKMMYVSMWGEATWQFWREDGLAFDAPTAGIVYEVNGGIEDGKTHAELGIPPSVTGPSTVVSAPTASEPAPSNTASSATAKVAAVLAGMAPLAVLL